MLVLGIGFVVAGGLVSAVTSPLHLTHGSWLAAYLVLVCGVGQSAMGAAQLLAADALTDGGADSGTEERRAWAQLGAWNLGNALVISGTLAATPLVVDGGSVVLLVSLVLALLHSRRLRAGRLTFAYRVVLLIMIVSLPIGVLLSHLRH